MCNNTINAPVTYECHRYEPYIPQDTKCLIVGTFPRYIDGKTKGIDWYYGSANNPLWQILCNSANTKICRMKWADVNKIGFMDLYYKVIHYNKSSSDSDIIPLEYYNLISYLYTNLSITTILCTSQLVGKLLKDIYKDKYIHNKQSGNIQLQLHNEKAIEVKILPSPSRRNTMRFEEKEKEWENILKECCLSNKIEC